LIFQWLATRGWQRKADFPMLTLIVLILAIVSTLVALVKPTPLSLLAAAALIGSTVWILRPVVELALVDAGG